MFSRVWSARIHGHEPQQRSNVKCLNDNTKECVDEGESMIESSKLISLPPPEQLKSIRVAHAKTLHVDAQTAPDFMALLRFPENWEAKWEIGKDYLLRNNILIQEQYVGGDPDDLLVLHLKHVRHMTGENDSEGIESSYQSKDSRGYSTKRGENSTSIDSDILTDSHIKRVEAVR